MQFHPSSLFSLWDFFGKGPIQGANASIVVGFIAGVAFFICNEILSVVNIHFLYVAMILFVVTIPVIVIVSLLTPAPAAGKTEGLTWTRMFYRAETKTLRNLPWYQNYRVQSMILLAVAFVIFAFWW